jgi:crooked neck
VVLLEGWKKFEEENGTPEDVEKVQSKMPQVTKRWRRLESGDMEECELTATSSAKPRELLTRCFRLLYFGHSCFLFIGRLIADTSFSFSFRLGYPVCGR